jgi:hypothetical protein
MRKKYSLLIFMLLFSGFLFAQSDDNSDTTILQHYTDTTAEVTAEPVDEGAGNDNDDHTYQDNDKESEYFLRKDLWGTEADSAERKLPDSILKAMHTDEDFWYANTIFKKKQAKEGSASPVPRSNPWETLLWIFVIVGFLAFLGIYLANSNIAIFRRSRDISTKDSETPELDDIFAINYQKEIDKAVAAGNYRLAVRLLFLRTLRQLSDKQVIRYTQDQTNFDYLMQLMNTAWYQPFFRLVRNYEYIWYGKFDINKERFDLIRNEFTNFEQRH